MSDYNPVGWFEVPVEDLDRAEKFYEIVLDIKMKRQERMNEMDWSWFPMVQNGKGSSGSLMKHDQYKPAPNGEGVVIYFTTPDIDAAIARVEPAGGKLLFPKKDIGEYGFIAGVRDTEGNHVALHTAKK